MPFGPDTFTVTVESEEIGMGIAQKKAIADAKVFCQSEGRHFQPIDSSLATSDYKYVYSLIFKCVDNNVPND